jgi:energy-coupling factor transport system ATP-binding protein
MSLEVRHLSYAFQGRDTPYLRDVSLTVGGGEIVVICGPSGGGKSTLIKCIDGIYPYVNGGNLKGDILVDGSLAGGQPPEARSALIGTVFQDFDAQIIHLTTEDELAFGPENLGIERSEIKRRVEKVSSIIRLDPGADPCTLSGGNKQRLCIGSTLAMETPVLLLDEPLSNLDIGGARSLMEFLKSLKEKGRAILIVEHRLNLVKGHADRVLWMESGRLSETVPEKYLTWDSGMEEITGGKGRPGESIVSVNGLSFAYDKQKAVLSSVSFSVMKGEMAVILGKNGSGKSTLLKIIAGLLPVQGGSVELCGKPIKGRRAAFFRERVGLVMQNPNHQLFMDSVYNEIFFNCRDAGLTAGLMETFGLAALKDRHPYSLSEGEKRRLAVASILASKPSVLLLDEPTLGQDRDNMAGMIKALTAYNRKTGLTVITVTHEETAARSLGNKAIFLQEASASVSGDSGSIDRYFQAGDAHGGKGQSA